MFVPTVVLEGGYTAEWIECFILKGDGWKECFDSARSNSIDELLQEKM